MLDANYIFSSAQSIVANATTVASTNLVDLGALIEEYSVDAGTQTALSRFGPVNGRNILKVAMVVAPSAGTALYLDLEDCATAGGTYKPTGVGVDVANAIPIATLVAGYTLIKIALPPDLRRYLRVLYTTTGDHTGSAGTINAQLEFGSMSENVAPYRA